jgi:hypothetical protein
MRFWTRLLVVAGLQAVAVPNWVYATTINERESKPSCTKSVVPGQSIQKFLYKPVAGDVICVHPGTYHETLSIAASGTADAAIVIRGEGGRPVIDGQYTLPAENKMDYSKPRLGCPGMIDGKMPDGAPTKMHFECTGYYPLVRLAGSYITFEGFEVVNSTGAGISAVSKSPHNNITIRNNYVHSVRDNGILLWQVDHGVVEHNEVADAQNFAPFWRDGFALSWGSGIGAYASHFIEFNANVIHDNWGDALLVDINKGGSTDITIADNILYQNYSSNGIYAHAVKRLLMRRNLMYCPTMSSMPSASSLLVAPTERQYVEDIDTEDVIVENNIFVGCPKAHVVLWDTKPQGRLISNLVFANNTIYGGGTSVAFRSQGQGFVEKFSLSNNLIVNATFSVPGFASSNNRTLSVEEETGFLGIDGKGAFPTVLAAGTVDPQWFRIRNYSGVGADVSGFRKAGLLPASGP